MITLPLAPGKSHCPWVTIQERCAEASAPLQPGRKLSSALQDALDLDFFNLFCSLQEDQTTEAHSSYEHLSERPLLPAL